MKMTTAQNTKSIKMKGKKHHFTILSIRDYTVIP